MSAGRTDDGEEWDAAPAVVKRKVKKKTETAHNGEWDSASAPSSLLDEKQATPPSSATGNAASASSLQQRGDVDPPLGASGENLDLEALQQKVIELDAQLEVEEQERLIREALLTTTTTQQHST